MNCVKFFAGVVCLTILSVSTQAALTNNMVALYHFDGDMKDSTPGSSDTGTISGAAAVNQDNVQVGTYSFESQAGGEDNGAGEFSFGTLPEGSEINGSNNWTITLWVNSKATQAWRNAFSFDGESSMRLEDGNGSWRFYASGYNDIAGHAFTKQLNKWTFFAITADGNTLRVFQGFADGSVSMQYSEAIDAGEALAGGSTMVLGGRLSNPPNHDRLLNCYLDEVGIWTRSLSTNEVSALFAMGKAKFNFIPQPELMDNLTALYHFDGDMKDSVPGSTDEGSTNGLSIITQENVQVGTYSFKSQDGGKTNAAGELSMGLLPEGSEIDGGNYWTITVWVDAPQKELWGDAFSFDTSSSFRLENGAGGASSTGDWRFYASGYNDIPSHSFTKQNNKWTFFAITADGSTLKVYQGFADGNVSLQYSETIDPGESLAGGSQMVLGARRTGNSGNMLNCYLDELALWIRPLSSSEVEQVFTKGKNGKNIAPIPPQGTLIVIK